MSENNPSLDNVQNEVVVAEGEQQVTGASDEHKTPKMKDTGNVQPKKRGRKPKAVVAAQETEKSDEEFKPEKEGSDGDEDKAVHSPKTKKRSNKDSDDEDEEYGNGDESDDDYDGKKQLKKKVSRNSSAKKPASGAKRGRKPKSQAQKEAEEADKKAAAAASAAQTGTSEASQQETNDAEKETEGTPSLPNGKRVTRTSSGRLPNHQEVFQPTFKKYKPTKKEEEANNQAGEVSQVTEQSTETSGKHETNGKGDASLNSTGGDDQVNAKRAHSALEGTSPANILTQDEFTEVDPEKKLKTDSS